MRLVPAAAAQRPLVDSLLQHYLQELAAFTPLATDARGRYDYPYLDHYWRDPQRSPWLLEVDNATAGLALLREDTDPRLGLAYREIAEFFVLPEHRRQGLGRQAALGLLRRYPGAWQLGILAANQRARVFWQSVLAQLDTTATWRVDPDRITCSFRVEQP